MADHEHDWVPIAGLFGRYSCSYGVTGYRATTGEIRAHKTTLAKSDEVSVWPYLDHDGRIPPKPTSRG